MSEVFRLDDLLKIVSRFKTLPVKEYKEYEHGLIMRHDVDFSIDMAYEFSRKELENGIKSTFYILVTSDMYNPFSGESRKKIDQLLSDGFEIGLHFDPLAFGQKTDNELLGFMNAEIDMLEQSFGFKVKSYSMHNPSLSGIYLENPELINAYDQKIFSPDNYISDSCYSYRGKDLETFLEKSNESLVQFLTHPIHFFSNGKISYEVQVNEMVEGFYRKLNRYLEQNHLYRAQYSSYNTGVFCKKESH